MIYLRLAGGLGNQLYQIAAAALFSKKLNVNVGVLISGLNKYKAKREPEFLKIIGLDQNLFVIQSGSNLGVIFGVQTLRCGRWLPMMGTNDKNFESRINNQKTFKTQFMDGYFQSHWDLERFRFAIESLNFIDFSKPKAISESEVIVHVRGGDFKLSHLHLVDEDYYSRAVDRAIRAGWRAYRVISDDPEYSTRIFKKLSNRFQGLKYKIEDAGRSTIEDFNIIRSANARIIGNSTFAWWATALGNSTSPTWTPKMFLPNIERKLVLPNEICIDN